MYENHSGVKSDASPYKTRLLSILVSCIILQDDVCEFTAAVWARTGFHPMGVHGGKLNFPMCWSLKETTSHTPPRDSLWNTIIIM